MSQYVDRVDMPIMGTGSLMLYKRPELDADIWHYRAKIEGKKGYIRRSTKETNLELAKRVADDEFRRYKTYVEDDREVNIVYVRNAITKYFSYIEGLKKYENKQQRVTYIKNTWNRYMQSYFGDKKITEITDDVLTGYWDWRNAFYITGEGKDRILANKNRVKAKTRESRNIAINMSYGTARSEASIINMFFAWCYASKQGYTNKVLRIKATDAFADDQIRHYNRRPHFTDKEWHKIRINLSNYVNGKGEKWEYANKHSLHRLQRYHMRLFILFLASTGMRLGEAKQIRWKDIRYDKFGKLRINVDADISKVRRQRTVIPHSDWIGDKELKEWKEKTEFNKDTDLVFYTKDKDGKQKVCDVSVSFKTFLKKIGLLGTTDTEEKIKNRTLYSLRHTYATLRLEAGTEVYNLAKNMGTSVTQIERHYGHVAVDKIIDDLQKNTNIKDRQEVKDLEQAANLIKLAREGAIDAKAVAKAIDNIVSTKK